MYKKKKEKKKREMVHVYLETLASGRLIIQMKAN